MAVLGLLLLTDKLFFLHDWIVTKATDLRLSLLG